MRIPFTTFLGVLIIGIGIALLLFNFFRYSPSRSDAYAKLQPIGVKEATLGMSNLTLFIADTDEEKTRGLSGILNMDHNEGVLFQFDSAGRKIFWMKDMNFPLDFIYVRNGQVVEIKEDISPDTYPNNIINTLPADIVIELNAGYARKYNIRAGDFLELNSN